MLPFAHKDRLPWFLPMMVAVLLAGVGWWADGIVRRALEKKLGAELETVIDANVTALDIWMSTQQRLALGIAEDPEVRAAALAILVSNPPPALRPEPGAGFAPGSLRPGQFDRTVQPRMRTAGYFVAQLVTTNLVIATGFGRGRGWGGVPVPDEHQAKFAELFATGEPVIITPFQPRRDPGRGPGFGRSGPGARGGPRNPAAFDTNRPPDRPFGPPPGSTDTPPPRPPAGRPRATPRPRP